MNEIAEIRIQALSDALIREIIHSCEIGDGKNVMRLFDEQIEHLTKCKEFVFGDEESRKMEEVYKQYAKDKWSQNEPA